LKGSSGSVWRVRNSVPTGPSGRLSSSKAPRDSHARCGVANTAWIEQRQFRRQDRQAVPAKIELAPKFLETASCPPRSSRRRRSRWTTKLRWQSASGQRGEARVVAYLVVLASPPIDDHRVAGRTGGYPGCLFTKCSGKRFMLDCRALRRKSGSVDILAVKRSFTSTRSLLKADADVCSVTPLWRPHPLRSNFQLIGNFKGYNLRVETVVVDRGPDVAVGG
jgi:hypothetical protein